MSGVTYHCHVDVRGILSSGRGGLRRATAWLRNSDGSRLTVDELQAALLDELAQGHEALPSGDCDNFDFKTGCRGHRDPEPASTPAPAQLETSDALAGSTRRGGE